MKAYIGQNKKFKRNINYEVGKTYILKGTVDQTEKIYYEISPDKVLSYHTIDNDFVLFEVDVEEKIKELNKHYLLDYEIKIFIIRLVPVSEYSSIFKFNKFDNNGNHIYAKTPYCEVFRGYDENNKLICYKDSLGFFENHQYDENGNEIYSEDSHGYKINLEYDKNNNIIKSLNSYGEQIENFYNENNQLTKSVNLYCHDNSIEETLIIYDDNGNIISEESFDNGDSSWVKSFYDKNNLIYYEDSENNKEWYKYDNQNNLIHYKDNDNYEYFQKFDENNNLIYYKDNDGSEYSITIF